MTILREAAQQVLEWLDQESWPGFDEWVQEGRAIRASLRAALAEPTGKDDLQVAPQEPVAWRDHVEQRLLNWRQRFVNRSGDQFALDDFMDQQSIDDLIDYVCDEYTHPAQQCQPLTDEEILAMVKTAPALNTAEAEWLHVARAIEKAHGIGGHGIGGQDDTR